MSENIRLRLIVTGRVQGVGFRYFTEHVAHRIGVTGMVRNLPDGSVEAEVQGESERVERFIADIRVGPHGSRVDDVRTTPLSTQPGEDGFEIRY